MKQPWQESWRADPRAALMADRHYNRQTIGSAQFVAPGRCLVLKHPSALWVTSWPYFAQHAWRGAWINTTFRREAGPLASELITAAVAATRWLWPDVPSAGMVTFVDPTKVRPKRDPGRCYLRAGFRPCGRTLGGLIVLQLLPEDMPDALPPRGAQLSLRIGEVPA